MCGLGRRSVRSLVATLTFMAAGVVTVAVIHAARDGGYVLLGLARTDPSLFDDIAWSTDTVAATTIARIRALGWSLFVGDTLSDIDEPADLVAAERPA